MNRDDDPDRPARSILCSKPDQVGIVELFRLRDRQSLTWHIKVGIAQPFSGCTVSYALKASDQEILGRPESFNFEGPRSVGRLQGAISCDCLRPSGEWPQLDLAPRTVRSPDSGNADAVFHGFIMRAPRSREGQMDSTRLSHASLSSSPSPLVGEGRGGGVVPRGTVSCLHSSTPTPDPSPQGGGEQGREGAVGLYAAGFGAAAAGFRAAAAALAAASALALRSLRGTARSGLLRAGRLRTPAASRKRKIRSDGVAPLASQLLAFSISNLTRCALSFGRSGLK